MGPGMVAVFERPPPWGRQGYFPVYNFEHQCQPLLASTRGSHQGCPVRLLCRGAMLSFATMQAISPFNCLSCARYVLRGPRIKVTDRRPGRCKSSHVDLQPHEARKPSPPFRKSDVRERAEKGRENGCTNVSIISVARRAATVINGTRWDLHLTGRVVPRHNVVPCVYGARSHSVAVFVMPSAPTRMLKGTMFCLGNVLREPKVRQIRRRFRGISVAQ
ncbi:hypothetical protein M433DRAFT_457331 [Acidomyces richmondensis BFW]|nr:hypothetical protein M433DRAFT_457331 [Acidomyces richmondensis BFW]